MDKEEITFQSLPIECLIEIIKHLRWTEKGSMSQTSKRFNDIVSTNTKLLEKNVFKFSNNVNMDVRARKYTRFVFQDCENQNLQNFWMIFADNLEHVREITIGLFNSFSLEEFLLLFHTPVKRDAPPIVKVKVINLLIKSIFSFLLPCLTFITLINEI
jgi:hypothetical protein